MGPEAVKVAVIGCGWAGSRHARAYADAGAQVLWAVDSDPERAERTAQALRLAGHPTRADSDYRRTLQDPRVSAVSVALPHHLHAPVSQEALRAGKHVLVEKPLANTLEEADEMIRTAEEAGRVLMVAEDVHFDARVLKVRELIRSGAIGEPAYLQIERRAYLRESFLRDRPWFLDARKAGGGMMMSGGVHDYEKARLLVGEPVQVQGLRARQRFLEMEGDDTSVALVRFRNGAVGVLVESFIAKELVTAGGPEVHTLRVDGDLGSVRITEQGTVVLFSEAPGWQRGDGPVQQEFYVDGGDPFLREAEHFLECVATGAEPVTSGRRQRRPLELVLATYRSMEAGGAPVRV